MRLTKEVCVAAKHSGKISSYYFRLLFVSVDEKMFSFSTGFIV